MTEPVTGPTRGERLLAVAVLLVFAVVVSAVLLARTHLDILDAAPAPAAARTSLFGLTPPASGDPDLPSLRAARPPAGTVVQAAGPFDDRFHFTNLAFDGTRVTATAVITSDVSDLLEFQALAGFYDSDGSLLGVERFTYHHTDDPAGGRSGPPTEVQQVTIPVPPTLTGRVAAAALAVPVLVNE